MPFAASADKAYDSQKVRQQIKDEGALSVISTRSNATKNAYCPKRIYRRQHKIENHFCRIKDWRRIPDPLRQTRSILSPFGTVFKRFDGQSSGILEK